MERNMLQDQDVHVMRMWNLLHKCSNSAYMLSHTAVSNIFATPWTVTCQAPLSMGIPGQEYWSGLPFHSPGYFPNPGVEPMTIPLTDGFFTTEPPGKSCTIHIHVYLLYQNTDTFKYLWLYHSKLLSKN